MTNEQRKAIEICKEKIIEPFYDFPNPTSIELKDTDVRAIEMVLSMLQEQQEKMDKKDKQIDLMAEIFYKRFKAELLLEYGFENEEQLKQYFADLVEKE